MPFDTAGQRRSIRGRRGRFHQFARELLPTSVCAEKIKILAGRQGQSVPSARSCIIDEDSSLWFGRHEDEHDSEKKEGYKNKKSTLMHFLLL